VQVVKERNGRSSLNIHASDLTHPSRMFCARERVLREMTNKTNGNETLTTALAVTFEIGHRLQDFVVETLGDAGVGYADWKCLNCKTKWDMSPRPPACKCGGHVVYEERRFLDPKYRASCGVDAFFKHNAKLIPVEVKTIDKDEFKSLFMPLAEHKARTRVYLSIMSRSEDPMIERVNLEEARVLYVSKGGYGTAAPDVKEWKIGDSGFSPFKEFRIERNDADAEVYLKKGLAYVEAKAQGLIPGGCCANFKDKRAYECPVRQECFSDQYPIGAKWSVKGVTQEA
jgi:hypothetical protein